MKVLWFSNTRANADEYFNKNLKGSGGWLKALDQELQNEVDLHVAFDNGCDNTKVFKYQNTTYYPIQTHKSKYHKYWSKLNHKVFDNELLDKYLDIINFIKPDIIHIHGTENPYGCIVQHTKVPVVVSIQGILSVILKFFFAGFDKSFLNVKSKRKSNLKKFLFPTSFSIDYENLVKTQKRELRSLKHFKYIMGRTDFDRRVSSVLAPDSVYFKDSHELLRTSFYRHEWNLNSNAKFIIHSTMADKFYKGFENVCYAISLLNELGFNFEWHVAGVSENDLIVNVTKRKLINAFPKTGLILLGRLDEKALITQLTMSDIFVMSSHIENSVNSLCEAMILGMPCISTYVGGVGSLIKDREDGLLIQAGDPWSLAGAILEVANNKELAVRLGKNARETALQRHDKEKIVTQLISNYQKIIDIESV
jgi:glycosyltransferase involved in cell wall biosynthesis